MVEHSLCSRGDLQVVVNEKWDNVESLALKVEKESKSGLWSGGPSTSAGGYWMPHTHGGGYLASVSDLLHAQSELDSAREDLRLAELSVDKFEYMKDQAYRDTVARLESYNGNTTVTVMDISDLVAINMMRTVKHKPLRFRLGASARDAWQLTQLARFMGMGHSHGMADLEPNRVFCLLQDSSSIEEVPPEYW